MRDRWAVLYDACAQARLGDPETIRQNLLWRVAAALGANRPPDEQQDGGTASSAEERLAAQNAGDIPDWIREENDGADVDQEWDMLVGRR